uniref:UPF0496 protein At1g20180 n=1 Tax=Erigeron canadensis TaxID=72917 RepID=UPI001CB9B1EC|nr:UPF0496 protein At1g20180 [Erigeron canadensis]
MERRGQTKMKFSKFKFSSIRSSGKYDKESTSSFINETDVNEEYKKAFRTQSYTDIYNQVQTHMRYDRGSSSSSIHDHYVRLCDILLEPQSETIANLDKTFNLHHLLLEFFKAGVEAWKICEDLLESIHQINTNYRKVEQIINLAQRVPNGKQCPILYEELASYSSLMNPLSDFGPEKFPKVHTNHKMLLKRLTTKHIRIKRKDKIIKIVKKSGGCVLVGLYVILAVTLLVLACHGLVVAAASPGLIACSLGLVKKASSEKKGAKMSDLKRVVMQLDVAAKGVYTMIKDLDTMGWLVGRLHNDVEFGRSMAQKCIKNRNPDVLEEVVREFNVHGRCFLEQLEELEDHIYLCLLNVNRSRRLLVEEIIPGSQN